MFMLILISKECFAQLLCWAFAEAHLPVCFSRLASSFSK